jgi:hypothetical protein
MEVVILDIGNFPMGQLITNNNFIIVDKFSHFHVIKFLYGIMDKGLLLVEI